jgi:hypothetical protein
MRRLAATLLAFSVAGCTQADPAYRVALPDGWKDGSRHRSQFEQGINAGNPGWAQYRLRQVAGGSVEGTWIILATFREPPRTSLRGLARQIVQYSAGAIRRIRNALIRHGGDLYLASLTSTPAGFRRDSSALADVLASWRWT